MNPVAFKKLQKKLKPALLPASFAYAAFLNLRDIYYSNKKPREFEGAKIISVGNIVVGGVGKTPLVIELAKFFKNYGRTCIITNNYPLKDKLIHMVSIDGNIFKKPPKVSDEPYMIAKKVNATVIASKNREAAIELSLGLKAKFIILDDALHKRRIKKDLEICVLDKYEPFGNGLYLPAGTLRDSKKALNRCDIVACIDKGGKSETKTDKSIDCIDVKMRVEGFFNKYGEGIDAKGKKAIAFAGIGNPEKFKETLLGEGVEIVGFHAFEDHHFYTEEEVELLIKEKEEKGAEFLITTFKDFVKLEDYEEIVYLDISLDIENLKEHLLRIVDEKRDN